MGAPLQPPVDTMTLPVVRSSLLGRIIRACVIMAGLCIVVTALTALVELQTQLSASTTMTPDEIAANMLVFGKHILIVSTLLMLFAAMVGYFLAKSIAWPLRRLSVSLRDLKPGNWHFARSVHTHDEVEVMDAVIADLTARLKKTYDHLEELVVERTQELQKEYALDRAILDGIEYGVAAVDAAGKISDVNPAFTRLLGFDIQECFGKPATQFLALQLRHEPVTEPEHPVTLCLTQRAAFRSTATMRASLRRKDGTELPVLLMASPLVDQNTVLGAIVIFQDVTEDRKVDEMKSEFITLASHQLRTPLSAIRWNLEILESDATPVPPAQKPPLDEIDHSSQRMTSILDALLQAARLEEGGYTAQKQTIQLADLITDAVHDADPQAKASGVTIKVHAQESVSAIATDPLFADIIVRNLISNAVAYSPNGGTVDVSLAADSSSVTLTVQDHGVGIPVNEQHRVFQKFFRAANIRSFSTDGNGLGLYITKRAVETIGGEIRFVSEEGRGTTFIVKFPLT